MKTFLRPLLAAAIVLFAVQCQDQESPVAVDDASWNALALAATQEQLQQAREIDRLIRELFKDNEEQTVVNKFCNAANLFVRGNVTLGQKRFFELMNLTLNRSRQGNLQCGQSSACRTKLANLFNASNDFFGLAEPGDDPIPPAAFQEDGAVQPCGPGGCLVVTGTEFAGVRIPPGAIGENVVVFVHRLPDAAEPLNTSLDQYPLFYFFGTSPEVEFNAEVNVALCVLDNPPFDIGAPPGAELRIAHNVGEGIEILPLGPSDFIDCTDAAPMAFHTPAWQGFVADALRPFSPSLLYAMPGTLGSRVSSFSPFAAVDIESASTAPTVAVVEFPEMISSDANSAPPFSLGTFSFTDPDADVVEATVSVISDPDNAFPPNTQFVFAPGQFGGDGFGVTSGEFLFGFGCSFAVDCTTGTVGFEIVLEDAEGNVSEPASFSTTFFTTPGPESEALRPGRRRSPKPGP